MSPWSFLRICVTLIAGIAAVYLTLIFKIIHPDTPWISHDHQTMKNWSLDTKITSNSQTFHTQSERIVSELSESEHAYPMSLSNQTSGQQAGVEKRSVIPLDLATNLMRASDCLILNMRDEAKVQKAYSDAAANIDISYFMKPSWEFFGCQVPSGLSLSANGFLVLPSNIKRLKIDAGLSFNAPNSNFWLNKIPNLAVFGFEPNRVSVGNLISGGNKERCSPKKNRFFKCLDRKFIGNQWFPFPVALHSAPSTSTFHNSLIDPGTSSLFRPITKDKGPSTHFEVPVRTLSELFSRIPWGNVGESGRFQIIEHLKTDAQGADLAILKGAGHYLRERVVCVKSEKLAPGYATHVNFTAHGPQGLMNYMISQGFRLTRDTGTDYEFVNTHLESWVSKVDCTAME